MNQKASLNQKAEDHPYSKKEAQRRFLAALKAAVNTPPKPLKSMTPKRPKAQSKKKRR
jgi:hypothetical protein